MQNLQSKANTANTWNGSIVTLRVSIDIFKRTRYMRKHDEASRFTRHLRGMTEDMFRSTDERSAVIYKLANNIFSHGLIDAIIEKFGKSHFGWGKNPRHPNTLCPCYHVIRQGTTVATMKQTKHGLCEPRRHRACMHRGEVKKRRGTASARVRCHAPYLARRPAGSLGANSPRLQAITFVRSTRAWRLLAGEWRGQTAEPGRPAGAGPRAALASACAQIASALYDTWCLARWSRERRTPRAVAPGRIFLPRVAASPRTRRPHDCVRECARRDKRPVPTAAACPAGLGWPRAATGRATAEKGKATAPSRPAPSWPWSVRPPVPERRRSWSWS